MKRTALVFLCIVLAFSFTIEDQTSSTLNPLTSKIPEFIGQGYNLLTGNPFTNHIDEGFTSPIFDLTYEKGQETEDGKYKIPDHTHSTETISCSI